MADIDAILRLHVRGFGEQECDACGQFHPCFIRELAEEVKRARFGMSQPRALLVESFKAATEENARLRGAYSECIKDLETVGQYWHDHPTLVGHRAALEAAPRVEEPT